MKPLTTTIALLAVVLASLPCAAELAPTREGATLTVAGDHYVITFDASRGATVTKVGPRAVAQLDAVGPYTLAADPNAEVSVREQSPDRLVLVARGSFVKDGDTSPSKIRAEHTWTFLAASPIVRCRAVLRQDKVVLYADVFGYASHPQCSVLHFGEEQAWKGDFRAATKTVTAHLDLRSATPLTVSKEDAAAFDALAAPPIERGEELLKETFETNDRWTDLMGAWRVSGGVLEEHSPAADFAWSVAGARSWSDYVVETQVRDQGGSEIVFLCARWQDLDNHYELQYLEHPANVMRIVRVKNGRRMTLAEVGDLPDLRVQPHTTLALAVNGLRLRAYRNGELLLEACDSAFSKGPIALGTAAEYPVYFHRVSVHAQNPEPLDVPAVAFHEPVQRHGYYRDEKSAELAFVVAPETDLRGATVTFRLRSDLYPRFGDLARQETKLPLIKAGDNRIAAFDVRPELWRSGDYTLWADVTQGDKTLAKETTEIFIRRRPNPKRMLVNAWDQGDPERLAHYGFNQLKLGHDNTMSRWRDGKFLPADNPERMLVPSADARRQAVIDRFDEALKHGMWAYFQIEYTRRLAEGVPEAYALKRNGKDLQDSANHYFEAGHPRGNPWHPENVRVITDFFRQAMVAWKDLPAWHALLLNSESENTLDVYGNDYFLEMAKNELGFDVPEDVVGPRWPEKGKELPEDGIIDTNDPHYRFYRWWAERGEGQPQLHLKVANAVKEIRPDLTCWHDPALRQPFVRGRLTGLDQVLNWSYAWPNVTRFPLIADEFRLAAPGQEHIFNIQLIVWGTVAIPPAGPHWDYIKRQGLYLPAHSPAIVSTATWMVLSRGITGVSYHAVETVDNRGMTKGDARKDIRGVGYRAYLYSNPDTLLAIKDISERVIQPYGTLIKDLPPMKAEVAMLLSTANAVLARRDPEDFMTNEAGHMYAKFLAAHVPVDPLYEIDVEEGKLARYKAVALPGCRVLPRHIYDAIKAFADAGGIVFADQHLVPSFPNVVTLPRDNSAWGGEAPLQKEDIDQAKTVRDALDDTITRWADCTSPTVVLSTLVDGDNRYLFVVNNLRRTGDYMAPWGKVLDDGVAQSARVSIARTEGVIYDVLARQEVIAETDHDRLSWDVTLAPGEGRVFAVLPGAVDEPRVTVPETVAKGTTARIEIDTYTEGRLPLRVTIRDSQGVENEYSDYVLATEGNAAIDLPIAKNDPAGDWTVTARELLGGAETRAFFRVVE